MADGKCLYCIESFHSRGHQLGKFISIKESVCTKKRFKSHRPGTPTWRTWRHAKTVYWSMNCVEGVRSRLRKPVVYLHHREIWWTATRSRVSAFLGSGFVLILRQIVSIKVKELSNTNLVASNPIKTQKAYNSRWGASRKRICVSSQKSVFTWRHGGHIGFPKQWNGGHVGVPNQSCGSWTLFLCKRFLLFQ